MCPNPKLHLLRSRGDRFPILCVTWLQQRVGKPILLSSGICFHSPVEQALQPQLGKFSRIIRTLACPSQKPWGLAGIAVLGLFVALYYFTATAWITQTNQNRLASDQQNNIDLARDSREDWWPLRTDGVVNPLWPWVAARFAPESDARFFERGKWFNVGLTCAALVGVAFWLRRRASPLLIANILVIGGLGCLLPQAGYFQPESLFYLLFTASWLLAVRLLLGADLGWYALFGLACGFAYLAKASVTPMVVVLVIATGLRIAHLLFLREAGHADSWSWKTHAMGLLVALVVSAVVVLPRAVYSWKQYGSPFHAYPKYWMWHDDFGSESVPFMARYNSAQAFASLPDSEKPSLRWYLARHGWTGFKDRLLKGAWEKTWRFYLPERKLGKNRKDGRWKYLLSARGYYLLGFLALLVGMAAFGGKATRAFAPGPVSAALFVLGGYLIYTLAYGWYDPIGRGDRFMMTLYLPLLGSFAWASQAIANRSERSWALFVAGNAVILVLVCMRVMAVMLHPKFVE
jgi:hypothetical protein